MPYSIHKTLLEWQLAMFSVVIGTTIAIFGNPRLGMYVLNVPGWGDYAKTVILVWGCGLWICGLVQIYFLVKCIKTSISSDCSQCPALSSCTIVTGRRWAAGASALVWCMLVFTFYSGGYFMLGMPTGIILSLSQFIVFTLLSKR